MTSELRSQIPKELLETHRPHLSHGQQLRRPAASPSRPAARTCRSCELLCVTQSNRTVWAAETMYTSVVFDWHRAISEIGSGMMPPTPSAALSTATTVVESSSGFVDRLTRHPPVSGCGSGSGSGSGAAGSVSIVSVDRSSGADAPHPTAKMSPTAMIPVTIPERIGLPPLSATA